MADVYSLNPQILPSAPRPKEEHRRSINGAILATIAIAVIGMAYWWWDMKMTPAPETLDPQARLRAEVVAVLRSSNVQPSEQEIDSVTAQLSESKPASQAERQSDADSLRRGSAEQF